MSGEDMVMDSKEHSLPSALLVNELYVSFQSLVLASLAAKAAIRGDIDRYPVYVPRFGYCDADHTSSEAREAAASAISQLFWNQDTQLLPGTGLVCSSEHTVSCVNKLNSAKQRFKNAVLNLRNANSGESPLERLIRDEITVRGLRTDTLKKALAIVGITTIDLQRSYAQIRVLPKHVEVFSWTWATKHCRIRKVTRDEAMEMAKNLPHEEHSKEAYQRLQQCRPNEHFVRRIKLPNQLRANYAYWENGSVVRKSCPISGIVLLQQNQMPRKLWRENPGDHENLERIPRTSGIERQVFIKQLDLYRYVR
jgi:hypothetical protein